MVKSVMFAWVALALSACAPARQYAGPARPQSQVARLVVLADGADHFGRMGDVRYDGRIVSVDGAPVRTMTGIVEVLPGSHEVVVSWQRFEVGGFPRGFDAERSNFLVADAGRATFRVEAEAGRRYRLRWPDADQTGPPLGFVIHR